MLACRTEYDRLVSTDVQPPGFVIDRYKRQFKTVTHKPEVVNVGIEQVHVAHGTEPDHTPAFEGLPITKPNLHGHRRHRTRRASTVLQDTIIDPQKAMQDGLLEQPSVVEVVVDQPPTTSTPFAAPIAQNPRGLMDNRLPSIHDDEHAPGPL